MGTRNHRRICAVYYSRTPGFEVTTYAQIAWYLILNPISAAILPTGSLLTICLTRCPESSVLHNSPLLNHLLLHHQGTSQTSVDHSLFPGLPSFYLLFAFRKMHRSGSLAKNRKGLGGIITSISLPHFQDELHSSCSTTHQNLQ